MILHLLGDVVEERTPLGGRTELRNVVGSHVNSLVGDHDHSRSGEVVEVVEVSWRSKGGEVGCWLSEERKREESQPLRKESNELYSVVRDMKSWGVEI